MSKLKKLAANFERYNITVDHKLDPQAGTFAKVTIVIPGENNTFTKRVSTNFVKGVNLQEAEKEAIDIAVDMILGNKLTKKITEKYAMFDIQFVPFNGLKEAPIGVKALVNVCDADGKPFRMSVSLATGTDAAEVEAEALKNVINSVLGV